jgi:MSHA pilin protein MshD
MSTRAARGVTLVELVMFMVIVGVALAAFFTVFSTITKGSVDPEVRKQLLAIAESLMEEVALMPFTYCDPNDANAATATSTAGCFTAANNEDLLALGPKNQPALGGLESRGSPTNPLVNVSGYNTFSMAPVTDLTNTAVTGLGNYSASVAVTQAGLGSAPDAITATDALRISVTATYVPTGASVTLEGYRTRYAPNTAP